jgi:hypothetical protein
MIPFQFLSKTPPVKGLRDDLHFVNPGSSHFAQSYARLQTHRRHQELEGAMYRKDVERTRQHMETYRPRLTHPRQIPSI